MLSQLGLHENSQVICRPCHKDLKYCYDFRNDLIEKQKVFIQLEREKDNVDEPIDDNGTKGFVKFEVLGEDPLEEEFLMVKIESIDVSCNNPAGEIEAVDARSESHSDEL